MENSCPICLNSEIIDSIQCKKCQTLFCKKCALLWKISHDECPLKCSKPWEIDLSFILKSKIHEGFIICPLCLRLGSLLCPKPSCRTQISYEEVIMDKSIGCTICGGSIKLYFAATHPNCDGTWNNSFYFFCVKCDQKFCNCILSGKKIKELDEETDLLE